MDVDWNAQLLEQLDVHWRGQLRPRIDSLSNDEYYWEPVPDCWNVRPRGTSHAPIQAGSGELTIDFAMPTPQPPPVTTIAWRLGHLVVGVLRARNATHFGGAPTDYFSFVYAGTAAAALAQLDAAYADWLAGVRSLDGEGLRRPCGPAEGVWAEHPMAALVLHINRELIHHGAEIALLRDLYAQQRPHATAAPPSTSEGWRRPPDCGARSASCGEQLPSRRVPLADRVARRLGPVIADRSRCGGRCGRPPPCGCLPERRR